MEPMLLKSKAHATPASKLQVIAVNVVTNFVQF
jgi:hypothetical protein